MIENFSLHPGSKRKHIPSTLYRSDSPGFGIFRRRLSCVSNFGVAKFWRHFHRHYAIQHESVRRFTGGMFRQFHVETKKKFPLNFLYQIFLFFFYIVLILFLFFRIICWMFYFFEIFLTGSFLCLIIPTSLTHHVWRFVNS